MKISPCGLSLAILCFTWRVSGAAIPNCRSNTWVNLTSLPSPRQEHTTVAIGETTIAIVGGIISDGASGYSTTDLLQLYDIPTNTWRTGSPVPFPVNHPNAAVVKDKLYLLGGLSDAPVTPPTTLSWQADRRSYVYHPNTDTWNALESIPTGMERGSAVMGVHGDMIYVAGGMTLLADGYQDTIDTIIAFNTSSGHWQRVDPQAAILPEGREHAVGSVVGDTFCVLGGRYFSQEAVRGDVFELDLKNMTKGWRTSSGHMPTPRGGLSGNAVGGKWYTFGGEGNAVAPNGIFNQSEAFDTQTQKWTTLRPMAVPRHGTHSATVSGRIYIPGGGLQQDGKAFTHDGTMTFSDPTDHFDAYCV